MAVLKCKMCGGQLEITEGMTVCECEYCGTQQTITTTKDENRQALFNRANILRMKSEFDKAEQLYEKLVQGDPDDAEAHWGLILCKYGIEYVEDPKTFKRIPTCHRTSYDSIVADEDYKEVLRCADFIQRDVYEVEAKEIDRIQKEILALSAKEAPYDVFICYKETNEGGGRTPDSAIANDIYYQLTNEGLNVFYAAISLEDKLGSDYEPCIFAALNSAKVMLVVGTKPEYFNAVWVKNEWSRFLKMMKKDRSKLLIPCYKDMDAYELPEEFAHLQAQDMGKIGFINDIVRGIKKVIVKDEPKPQVVQQTVVNNVQGDTANTESLLKRIRLFLEDGNWKNANEYCNRVLDINPECSQAYFYMLMEKFRIETEAEFESQAYEYGLADEDYYKKAYRFGDTNMKANLEELHNKTIYNYANGRLMAAKTDYDFRTVKQIFQRISNYSNAKQKVEECEQNALEYLYSQAITKMQAAKTDTEYRAAKTAFEPIKDFKDSAQRIEECEQNALEYLYSQAITKMQAAKTDTEYRTAKKAFEPIKDFKDSAQRIEECEQNALEYLYSQAITKMQAAKTDTEYRAAKIAFEPIKDFKDSAQRIEECEQNALEYLYTTAEKSFKNAQTEDEYYQVKKIYENLKGYKDSNEKVSMCEKNIQYIQTQKQKALEKQERKARIIATVVFAALVLGIVTTLAVTNYFIPESKYNKAIQLTDEQKYDEAITIFTELGDYKDSADKINEINYNEAVKLADEQKYDEATTVFTELGDYKDAADKINEIKYNKAVKLVDEQRYDEAITIFTKLGDYKDAADKINEINYNEAVKLVNEQQYDEAVTIFTELGDYKDSKEKVSAYMTLMIEKSSLVEKYISVGEYNTVGLKADGTVVAVRNSSKVSGWKDIVAVATGGNHFIGDHTIGLQKDGTVVAVGDNDNGQCDVSGWKDIVAVAAGGSHTVGLKADGTVVAVGNNYYGQCNVSRWKDIVAVAAGGSHTVGLKADGTVVAVGGNGYGQCDISDWKDIVAVSTGDFHTVGLQKDGTVVAAGYNNYGQCDVSDWKGIVAVAAGGWHTVGLKADGTVVAAGYNNYGQCDVSGWKDIVAVAAGGDHTVGLKADGTVVAVGQCNVSRWEDIVAVAAGEYNTVGLKADGTVVAVGGNDYGQCDVSDWKLKVEK